MSLVFQSTPSSQRATHPLNFPLSKIGFQSTPSSQRATQRRMRESNIYVDFNPRPPHRGRPHDWSEEDRKWSEFQSTPSSQRATGHMERLQGQASNFNPRPPHRGRRNLPKHHPLFCDFNPRPPHRGRPLRCAVLRLPILYFNPRPPHRGRPCKGITNINTNKKESEALKNG